MPRWLAATLTIGSAVWVLAIVLAPYGLPQGSIVSALTYYAGSLVCHQRPERSFHLAATAMPVCARCAALYVSAAAGAILAWSGRRPPQWSGRSARAVLALAALPTIATVVLEWSALAAPSSLVRAISALPLGSAAAWIVVRALRNEGRAAAARGADAL